MVYEAKQVNLGELYARTIISINIHKNNTKFSYFVEFILRSRKFDQNS